MGLGGRDPTETIRVSVVVMGRILIAHCAVMVLYCVFRRYLRATWNSW